MQKLPFDEIQQLWLKIAKIRPEEVSDFDLQHYQKLSDVFQVGDYYYYIFNLCTAEIEYIQENVTQILGYPPEVITPEFIMQKIHPDDLSYFLNFENYAIHFFYQFTPEKIMKYKIRYDYRIKKSNGEYIRVLQQLLTIQSGKDGGAIRVLGIHTDITHLKPEGKPTLSFIGLDNEPSFLNVEALSVFKTKKEIITKREKQILKYLVDGKRNSEIAIILSISKHTVDTHRKNILRKSETFTTLELVKKAIREGWI
ncbi:LuxR C-terminal-related transcriptional regulator [Flavobacterium sp. '19STA2R22 D10 B1']|uniref:LuxR C-terminal-related transcriptional regulator n=1 Tax=Flavobacterium aerium TaxID=3037261 RepID=UPI00278C1C14|nr:LuxR C-terminal-related transcriptional regulator [Flavobacterium sp. '19STA2R22 D10 B1']